jgi:hypothetical protein
VPNIGKCQWLVELARAQIASSSDVAEDVSAGVVERGVSVHLSCEFFDSGDVAFRGCGPPGQGELGAHGVVLVDEAVGGDTAGLRKGDPCVDVVVVALAGETGELADGEHGVAVLAYPRTIFTFRSTVWLIASRRIPRPRSAWTSAGRR